MNDTNFWNIKDLVTDLIGYTAETVPTPREVIWASDLGKPWIDRWHSMKGTPYSNPADSKGLFAFFLGKQIEKGLTDMLKTCEIAYNSQDKVEIKAEGCLPVVGRPDIYLEVKDWDKIIDGVDKAISELESGEQKAKDKKTALKGLLQNWKTKYPQGLPKTVFEVKSINSYAFKYHKGTDGLSNAYPHHRLQLYTYLKGLGLNEGHLVYIAKDTGWVEEVVIRTSSTLDKEWMDDVRGFSQLWFANKTPELEPTMVGGKANWQVNYSRYKDLLYKNEVTNEET